MRAASEAAADAVLGPRIVRFAKVRLQGLQRPAAQGREPSLGRRSISAVMTGFGLYRTVVLL